MPSVRDSSRIDMSQLTPANAPQAQAMGGPLAPAPDASLQMSPFFHAALPSSAATYDSLVKQFYRNSAVTTTRLLPAGGQL
jgi:hypothetical protein